MPPNDLDSAAQARLGTVLRGKYRLDFILGVGGMATVYAATHRNAKRVAIKMLHPEYSSDPDVRARFLREGYAANTVGHPGAVAVLDDDIAEDGSAFVVMELLEGASAEEVWLRYQKRVPVELAVSLAQQVLGVLEAAHRQGIVHRDLKPANLFVSSDGHVRVLDFGIARLTRQSDAAATQSGTALGTPAFMAPEQARGEVERVDGQSDLWALGATLFTLLTGEPVHTGDNGQQILIQAATRPARSIQSLRPDVPAAVASVVDRALAFEKRDRWASAAEMLAAIKLAGGAKDGPETAPVLIPGLEGTSRSSSPVSPPPGTAPTFISEDRPPSSWRWTKPRAAIAAGGAVAVAAGVLIYRAVFMANTLTCVGLAYTRKGPVCVDPVSSDYLGSQASVVHRLTVRSGLTQSVENITFAGKRGDDLNNIDATEMNGAPGFLIRDIAWARLEVRRGPTGAITDLIKYDALETQFEWQKWSSDGAEIKLVDLDGTTPRHEGIYHDYFGLQTWGGPFTSLKVTWDGQDRLATVRFTGPTGKPRPDSNFCYGYSYEYRGDESAWSSETCLDAQGQSAPNPDGLVRTVHEQAEGSHTWSFFGPGNRPLMLHGAHQVRLQATGEGWRSFVRKMTDVHGAPATWLLDGSHQERGTWDPDRRALTLAFFDEHGRPVFAGGAFAHRVTYDPRGLLERTEVLDENLALTMTAEGGVAAMQLEYDAAGRPIRQTNLDAHNAPIQFQYGYAREDIVPDLHGNFVEARHYDERGELSPTDRSGPVWKFTRDDRGLELSRSELDADGGPFTALWGDSVNTREYDRLRNLVRWSTFGADGGPVLTSRGFATLRREYSADDDLIGATSFDAQGGPVVLGTRPATTRREYDNRGLSTRELYLDSRGVPMLGKDGYAEVHRARDAHGDVVSESYLGLDGRPIALPLGYSRVDTRYDDLRRPVEKRLFDADGGLTVGAEGWTLERTSYDDRGLVARIDHLDAKGSPARDAKGGASLVSTYNDQGDLVEEDCLDELGHPIRNVSGFATRRLHYDNRRHVDEESYWDVDGKPIESVEGWSSRRDVYNDTGLLISTSYLDRHRGSVAPKGVAYASARFEFNKQFRMTRASYLDPRGAPTPGPDGAPVVVYVPDAFGRVLETRYLDGTESPATGSGGFSIKKQSYDFAGRPLAEHLLGPDQRPIQGPDGCFGHSNRYSAVGAKVEEACLDGEGKPMTSKDNWAIRRMLVDAFGSAVEADTYAVDGSLANAKDGVARRVNRFDDRHRLVESRFFGADGHPTPDASGAYSIEFAFDGKGNPKPPVRKDGKGKVIPGKGPDVR